MSTTIRGESPAAYGDLAPALADAVERDEFEVAVQPIVDMPGGALSGVEALLRWPGGPGPEVFVPLAETCGLIARIGRRVLSRALDMSVELNASLGWQVPVSVNVSARQLQDRGFVEHVRAELARTGTPGSALWLELTETAALHDTAEAEVVLTALRRLGCPVGLDDFGTGWSTLSLVTRLPLTFFKLDRSFVAALGSDRGSTVARSVLHLGRELGLDVIAEGVETGEQAAALQTMGCRLAQGYLYGRPTLRIGEVIDLRTPVVH